MCANCGCSSDGHSHEPGGAGARHAIGAHEHEHGHERIADDERGRSGRTVRLERDVLEKNAAFARENRAWLSRRGVAAFNLMSAPGAGKTALLEATIRRLSGAPPLCVLEGDQETERDAARIRAAGARAVQINTGTGCHLDAHTVGHALEELDPAPGALAMIENVGNLVCPALFDLGERAKVVLLSVTEGEDKPLKYPHAFRASDVLVLSKMDLAPHVDFDARSCVENARRINPRMRIFQVSARRGHGMDEWCAWLRSEAGVAGPGGSPVAP